MVSITSSDKLVGALASGLAVLRHLAASSTPMGVTRIARDLELNSSTCFNLLKTLVHENLVRFDELTKTYSVGLGLVELANGALEQASYVRMIQPYLQEISDSFEVTATLWHRTRGNRVVLLGRAENDGAIRVHMNIGQRLPMYLAALGRCMAAHSGLSTDDLRTHFEALRWESKPSFEQYLKEVDRARKVGFAVDSGSFAKGVTTVSAAVLDKNRHPVMAISAVGFSGRLTSVEVNTMGVFIKERAARVSRALAGCAPAAIPSKA
jgi:DNA-binding IclR family transcriptional regulator